MVVCRYEISVLVLKSTSHSLTQIFFWLYCFIRISCTLMSFLHSIVMFAFRTILNVFSRCIVSLESRALLGFSSFDCYFSISPTFTILFHNVTYLCQVLVSTNRKIVKDLHGTWNDEGEPLGFSSSVSSVSFHPPIRFIRWCVVSPFS